MVSTLEKYWILGQDKGHARENLGWSKKQQQRRKQVRVEHQLSNKDVHDSGRSLSKCSVRGTLYCSVLSLRVTQTKKYHSEVNSQT